MASHDDFTPEVPNQLDTIFFRDVSDAGTGLTDGIGVATFAQAMEAILSAAGLSIKHSQSESGAPGVNDDETADWEAGSIWVDATNDEVYICASASTGAAVWKQVASGGGGGGLTEKDLEDLIEGKTPAAPGSADELLWRDVSGTDTIGVSTVSQLGTKLVTDGGLVQDSDFTNASVGFLTKAGAGTYQVTRINISASATPTTTDDSASNYSVGSLWIDVTPSGSETLFMCVDDTPSAARWVQIGTDSVSLRAEFATWTAAAPAVGDTFPYVDTSATVGRATPTQIVSTGGAALALLDTVGSAEIDDEAVTNAKLAHVATDTIKGRTTAGTGDVEDMTPAEVRTMLNVEDGATADQTGAEIKAAYEGEADTNAFTDADHSKLDGIAAGAEVNPAVVSQADAEAGTATDERIWTAERVKQAIEALAPRDLWTTSETDTGKTGKSGGTVYVKCLEGITVATGTGNTATAHGITGLDLTKPVKIELFYGDGTDSYYGNAAITGAVRLYASIDSTNLTIYSASMPSGYTADVRLEYQKT